MDKINNIPEIYYKRKSQKYIIRIKTIISETRFTTNSTRTWITSEWLTEKGVTMNHKNVTFAGRGMPVINDATVEDTD